MIQEKAGASPVDHPYGPVVQLVRASACRVESCRFESGQGRSKYYSKRGEECGVSQGKYTLDCFTEQSVGAKFPENTYEASSIQEVSRIIHNCARDIAGIRQIQVWIDEPHSEPPIETPDNS